MFIIKKIISKFLYPLNLSILLLIVGIVLIWRNGKSLTGKVLITAATVILFATSYWPIGAGIIGLLESEYKPLRQDLHAGNPADENILLPKKILVLNGGIYYHFGYPSSSQLGYSTSMRMIEGIRLHKAIPGSRLYVSSAQGEVWDYNGETMRDFAWELGVKPEDVISVKTGYDTEGEAKKIKEIWGDEPFILVTSAAHMKRSSAIFKKAGLNFMEAPVGYHTMNRGDFTLDYIFPSHKALSLSSTAWHEYIGLLWGGLTGIL